MHDVRPAAVAGTFYSENETALARDVDGMLASASVFEPPGASPKALVVPHAGFVYSGPVAATAYASIMGRAAIQRVVLLGPSHRVYLEGVAAPSVRAMRTPLGDVEIDHEALDRAGVPRNDAAHAREHSLEVQLPFLQRVLPHARICPIVCGKADASDVSNVIEKLWGGRDTLIVISSDLSHYLPYDEGHEVDRRTAAKVVALDTSLAGEEACGYVGLRGLLVVARAKRLMCRVLDLRSSGDTAGPRVEVVGYGAFGFWETS